MLAPRAEAVAAREATRAKNSYGDWTIGQLDDGLRNDTPYLGRLLPEWTRPDPRMTFPGLVAC